MPKSITSGLSMSGSKIVSGQNTFEKKKESIPDYVESGHRPGYQGFIRGQQHYYGTTYGTTTRGIATHTFGPDALGNPVDEVPPNSNEHVDRAADNGPKYRLPGYAGYVPGSKFDFAQTFGNTTDQLIEGHNQMLSESPSNPRMLTTTTTDMLNGKATVHLPNPQAGYKEATEVIKAPDVVTGNIPGYAGFIRGSQHFYGSTYGETTTVAKEHDYNDPVVKVGLQPSPHKLGQDPTDLPSDRPPGYGGHVPRAKFEYSRTFGITTRDMVDAHKESEKEFKATVSGASTVSS